MSSIVRGTLSRGIVVGAAMVLWVVSGAGCASAPRSRASPAAGEPDGSTLRGPQLEGPELDPRGADFSAWLDDFNKKTHFNWDPPIWFGYGGGVEFVFTVESNGTLSMVDQVRSSGSTALDEAARSALTHSRYAPLPKDFPRSRVTMRVVFHYYRPANE